MDAFAVLMNEIQSLKKEIVSLREQNLTLYNELARHHAILNDAINSANGYNLGIHLTRFSGMQAAEFIAENMPKVKSFDNRNDYLKYILSYTKNVSGGGIWSLAFFKVRVSISSRRRCLTRLSTASTASRACPKRGNLISKKEHSIWTGSCRKSTKTFVS